MNRLQRLTESYGQLQLALEDQGWEKLAMDSQAEFSREGLRRAAELCRIMFIANPLIKRRLNLRTAYVHRQDVRITARADGIEAIKDVNSGNCCCYAKAEDKPEQELGNEPDVNSNTLTSDKAWRMRTIASASALKGGFRTKLTSTGV